MIVRPKLQENASTPSRWAPDDELGSRRCGKLTQTTLPGVGNKFLGGVEACEASLIVAQASAGY
jgi:hypothetical protein